jgi:plastocyanin domain-containing protein
VRWGQQEEKYLTLSSLTDTQVLEFTPQEPGDFKFNCPHDWYDGLMTVQ